MIPAATRHPAGTAQRTVAVGLLVAGLIAVAVLTLTPAGSSERLSFWCLKCGERPAVDLLLNVLLFVPVGTGLGLYGLRFHRAALFALGCTCLIEAVQFLLVPGRYASFRDILANFAGALIGYLLGKNWRVLVAPSYSAARKLAIAGAIIWLGTQAFTAWAMGLSPPPQPWWIQLQPSHDRYPAVFTGRILALSVGSVDFLRSAELPDDDAHAMRDQITAGAPLRTALTDVVPTRGLAPIAIISGGPIYDVMSWGQVGRDAVFRVSVRGSLVGLRTPSVRIANVIPDVFGDTVILTGSYRHGWYELQAHNRGAVRHQQLRASASWGWAFLLPLPLYAFDTAATWLTASYLAIAWCVLGYWNGRSINAATGIISVAPMAIAIAFGLAVVPTVFSLPIAHWSEWLASLLGAATGWLAAQRSVNRGRGRVGTLQHEWGGPSTNGGL